MKKLALFAAVVLFSPALLLGKGNPARGANRPMMEDRYLKEVFSSIKVNRDIVYGQAKNVVSGKNQKLKLDIYEPKGDTEPLRPVIVMIHGGGFINGDKENDKTVQLSKLFAKRGYVTVSIDYRLYKGYIDYTDTLRITEAVTQAYEDAKAAVRWLRAHATEYRLDGSRIAIGGTSAGAITALHAAYEENEGNSGTPGVSSEVAACISVAGALVDDTVMESQEAPLIIFHGVVDTRVPFTQALELEARAKEINLPYELHTYFAGHDLSPFTQQIVDLTSDFLYRNMIQSGPTSVGNRTGIMPKSLRLFQNYPNPLHLARANASQSASGLNTTIRYEILKAGEVSLKVYNLLGQEMLNLAEGWHEPGFYTKKFSVAGLAPGLYIYQLKSKEGAVNKKLIVTR